MLTPDVIFEDKHLLVISKPAGWVVNDANTVKTTFVIQTWLSQKFKYSLIGKADFRNGIVHRLDKDTSGILLVAKDKETFEKLQAQFKERVVRKVYTALLHGILKSTKGNIDAPIGRLPWNRERFGVYAGGRDAYTRYEVLKTFENDNNKYSLVKFYPKTGRTHQIRVHAKYLGNPIVTDEFYAGRKTSKRDKAFCPRLFLHASEITFIHPITNKEVNFICELPSDLKGALLTLS